MNFADASNFLSIIVSTLLQNENKQKILMIMTLTMKRESQTPEIIAFYLRN